MRATIGFTQVPSLTFLTTALVMLQRSNGVAWPLRVA